MTDLDLWTPPPTRAKAVETERLHVLAPQCHQ